MKPVKKPKSPKPTDKKKDKKIEISQSPNIEGRSWYDH
jgi:hypothetical protein